MYEENISAFKYFDFFFLNTKSVISAEILRISSLLQGHLPLGLSEGPEQDRD